MPFVGSIEGVRAFIPGAPGSGKTVDLAAHARAYIAAGQGVAAIDLPSASLLHSNGDAMDIAVKDGRIVGGSTT